MIIDHSEEHEIECLECAEGYYTWTDTDIFTSCDCCLSELAIDELLQELADRRFCCVQDTCQIE